MRVLVTGSRSWRCEALALRVLERLRARHGERLVIVHGAAAGVDSAFDLAAIRLGFRREPHPADWRRLGRAAGPKRNQQMVDLEADLCIAASQDIGAGRGTRDCIRRALAAGILMWLVEDDQGEPRRLERLE